MLLLAAAFIVAVVLLLYMVSPLISPKPLKLPGAHVVVSRAMPLPTPIPAAAGRPTAGERSGWAGWGSGEAAAAVSRQRPGCVCRGAGARPSAGGGRRGLKGEPGRGNGRADSKGSGQTARSAGIRVHEQRFACL